MEMLSPNTVSKLEHNFMEAESQDACFDSERTHDVSVQEDKCDAHEELDTDECITKDTESSDGAQPLIYNILDRPPIHLLIFFALQQGLASIYAPISCTVLVAEVICARNDNFIKTQILSATNMMVGLATILMTTIGVRLPIFQGPTPIYLLNFVAMTSMKEWQCPEITYVQDPITNATEPFALMGNGTMVPQRQIIYQRLAALSGSLVAAGVFHFLIGATGLVGVITKHVGPIPIVSSTFLVGLNFASITVQFSESNWAVAMITAATCFILSLYLGKRLTPIPFWNRTKGFHIFWYPLHQVLAILFGLIVGWIASAIMTAVDGKSDGDTTSDIISNTDWFLFPYPGKISSYSFNLNAFINFLLITLLSVLDAIGDYNLSARTARIPLPPKFAFNRGIAIEGLMCTLSGFMGCCHATISYGNNIAVMGITRVVSLRVFQVLGVMFIVFSIMGKLGAVFITVPYPVIGGIQLVSIGIFLGLILSYLEPLDFKSNRNLTILGSATLLGFMMPLWLKKNPQGIQTGIPDLDDLLKMLLSNSAFVAGVFAFILDNTVPGTLKERGLMSGNQAEEANEDSTHHRKAFHVYRISVIPDRLRRSVFAKIVPIFDKVIERTHEKQTGTNCVSRL